MAQDNCRHCGAGPNGYHSKSCPTVQKAIQDMSQAYAPHGLPQDHRDEFQFAGSDTEMTQGQQLDTSGSISLPFPPPMRGFRVVTWEDLPNDFVRGFIRAMFASACVVPGIMQFESGGNHAVGYSDLAPEALAMILRDCEAELAAIHPTVQECFGASAAMGASFFRIRQRGEQTHSRAEPLRISLNEDGKVALT